MQRENVDFGTIESLMWIFLIKKKKKKTLLDLYFVVKAVWNKEIGISDE